MEDVELDELTKKAKVIADATGRTVEAVLGDLLDDGIVNLSNEQKKDKDLVSQLQEAAALITTVQNINKEVSENTVLNGGDNKTEVTVDTTLKGDIVDRAIASVSRKAENIKKIVIIIAPVMLLLTGGVGLDYFMSDDSSDGNPRPPPEIIFGCTILDAENYDPDAMEDDGSCYFYEPVYGCMNDAALNYDPEAEEDDGSCIPEKEGCTDTEADNYDDEANKDDGSCEYPPEKVFGCTDSEAEKLRLSKPLTMMILANTLPNPECEAQVHNHYRGHMNNDPESTTMVVGFKVVPSNCDSFIWQIDLYQEGYDINYTRSGIHDSEIDVSEVFPEMTPGTWIPRITIFDDKGTQVEQVWFWSLDIVEPEQYCDITLWNIQFGHNNTTASVAFDLDCGTSSNDYDGYNVSVQFFGIREQLVSGRKSHKV